MDSRRLSGQSLLDADARSPAFHTLLEKLAAQHDQVVLERDALAKDMSSLRTRLKSMAHNDKDIMNELDGMDFSADIFPSESEGGSKSQVAPRFVSALRQWDEDQSHQKAEVDSRHRPFVSAILDDVSDDEPLDYGEVMNLRCTLPERHVEASSQLLEASSQLLEQSVQPPRRNPDYQSEDDSEFSVPAEQGLDDRAKVRLARVGPHGGNFQDVSQVPQSTGDVDAAGFGKEDDVIKPLSSESQVQVSKTGSSSYPLRSSLAYRGSLSSDDSWSARSGHPHGYEQDRAMKSVQFHSENGQSLGMTESLQANGGNLGHLRLQHVWESEAKEKFGSWRSSSAGWLLLNSRLRYGDRVTSEHRWYSNIVLGPDTLKRFFWDLLSILLLMHDVILFPMGVFDLEDIDYIQVMDSATVIFWTLDVPVSFLTGVYIGDVVEMRPSKTAMLYLKSWFAFDVSLVALDWSLMVARHSDTYGLGILRVGKTLRITRFLRALRLLRFIKVGARFQEWIEKIRSEQLQTCTGIAKLLIFLLFMNHVIACAWYGIATFEFNEDENWVVAHQLTYNNHVYCYFTAFHWSLTQFTPATSEIHPHNNMERIYTCIVLIFGLVIFSSFVSSITDAITRLRHMNFNQWKQKTLLRRYFSANRVSVELGTRIWHYFMYNHYGVRKQVHERDISVLKLLPESMLESLHKEVFMPVLTSHPFMFQFSVADSEAAGKVCHTAMRERSIISRHCLFIKNEQARAMFFLTAGSFDYILRRRDRLSVSDVVDNVRMSQWIAEAVLWTKWIHQGWCVACSTCELLELNASHFLEVAGTTNLQAPRTYATLFAKRAREVVGTEDELTDITPPMPVLQDLTQQAFQVDGHARRRTLQVKRWLLEKAHSASRLFATMGPNGEVMGRNSSCGSSMTSSESRFFRSRNSD